MNPAAIETLNVLLEGNARFRRGESEHYQYSPELIDQLATGQKPIAAVVACSDGRVSPEIIFDQQLANLFVSRVPGNVASDSAKWMLELAVTALQVPLVIILGHTGCLAVKSVVEGKEGAGGSLRMDVARAVQRAKMNTPQDLYLESIRENALLTTENLKQESLAVRQALAEGRLDIVTGVYDVFSGRVEFLDVPVEAFSANS